LGAKGDLSRWKLIPAIGNLAAANRLPSRFVIVGFAFDPLTPESFRQQLNDEIKIFSTSPIDPEFCQSLLGRPFRLENTRPSSRVAPPFFARELAGANPAMVYIGDRHAGSLGLVSVLSAWASSQAAARKDVQ
jgi:hypothetical protein